MKEFKLPLLTASAPVEDAFAPMILQHVSGVVIQHGPAYQLLHYAEILWAWEAGLATLGEIKREPAQRSFGRMLGPTQTRTTHFEILSAYAGVATVRSSSESLATVFLGSAPGCCCDGPRKHCYPPNTRGPDDNCTVPLCSGKVKGC